MNNIDERNVKMISEDADKIQIPEGLSPDNMMAKIARKKAEGYFENHKETVEKTSKKKSKISKKMLALISGGMATVVAAASVGIILLGSGANGVNEQTPISIVDSSYMDVYNSIAQKHFDKDNNQADNLSSYEDLAKYYIAQNTITKKKSATDKVKDFINTLLGGSIKGEIEYDGDMEVYPEDEFDYMLNESVGAPGDDISNSIGVEKEEGDSSTPDYSETNVRTEEVAEADVVKTDGEYIYYLNSIEKTGNASQDDLVLTIVKADGENSKKICEYSVREDMLNAVGYFTEIYYAHKEMMLYEDKLVVVCNNSGYTILAFYDLKDKSTPALINSLYMKGDYDSCRMVNGYLYVFAEKDLSRVMDEYYLPTNMKVEDIANKLVPTTSEGDISANDVYVSNCEDLNTYHMIGTVDMRDTSDFKQVKAILGSGKGELYVSANNIYYVSSVYEGYSAYDEGEEVEDSSKSEIIRLSYKDGLVETNGRTVIDGVMGDEFAIDEYNGYLRMAVSTYSWKGTCKKSDIEYYNGTKWVDDEIKGIDIKSYSSHKEYSALYVLDKDLKIVGSIPQLKENEQVYGVRFDGDIGYVVTYKQMDPLFTIDLSDPANPKVLGALKIPGFSTYLHKWDDNKLIGLGYDEYWQVKISTFDITDKTDVKETDVCVVDGAFGTDALYNHKAVFISPKNNLVGFMDNAGYYRIFSYIDGELIEVINAEFDDYIANEFRGLYIDEYIYIVGENNGVCVYKMSDYSKVAVVKSK